MNHDPSNAPQSDSVQQPEAPSVAQPPALTMVPLHKPRRAWQSTLLSVSFALFCLEVGAFLIVFPQQDAWNMNYFSGVSSWFQDVWDAPYFRWAITGIGVLNLYIAFVQIRNLFRS